MNYSKVLWSNDMSLCVGLKSELDLTDFMHEVAATHEDLTGDPIYMGDGVLTKTDHLIWKFEVQ